MGLTGLIYAAIVVAWAAYLVPLALRRHDEAARSRSVERFSSAMRVLSRRGSATQDRNVLSSSRQADRVLSPSLKLRAADTGVAETPVRPSRAAQQAAATRRRRVLIVLVILAVLVGVAAGFGLVTWWSVAIPAVLVVGFLVVARRQIRTMEEAFWVTASQQRPQPSNVVRRAAARVDASTGAAKQDAPKADPDEEPTLIFSAEQIAAAAPELAQRVRAVSMTTADGGSLWDPLPITLPTYVDKPAAKRTIRTIELGEPGTWSAGHHEADSRAAAAAASEAAAADAKELVEQERRAVNG